MRDLIEDFGYYLSCMMLFNGIYSVKIIAEGNVHVKPCNPREWAITLTCSIATLLVILGAAFTFKILGIDDSENNSIATGKKLQVTTVKDLTGENYFANFSLIVLTGLSLSSSPNFGDMIVFILIELALGVIYIKKKMFYMNPVLSLFDYSIYECSGIDPITKKALTGSIYFLVKGMRISIGDVIKYKNINSEIVRLNWRGKI